MRLIATLITSYTEKYLLSQGLKRSVIRSCIHADDLYILFSSNKNYDELIPTCNAIRNGYSSILKKHGLSLNVEKFSFKESSNINDELKKSLYDEYVNGIDHSIADLFEEHMDLFLSELYEQLCKIGVTHELYFNLIEKHFSFKDIEFTASEVLNYLVYESKAILRRPIASECLVKIINKDISVLCIDPKRLSVMVMQSGNNRGILALLNQLFNRHRAGLWNSYDTTIAIAYLTQSKFQHRDLLDIILEENRDLYAFYYYSCRASFISQVRSEKWNRYLRCIGKDNKAAILYFLSICEENRYNYLSSYVYYKNFFDRVSADMAHLAKEDDGSKKANYAIIHREGILKKLYRGIITDSDSIIDNANKLRNENPLSHSSAQLIDCESSSTDLKEAKANLDLLIDLYSRDRRL